MLTKTPILTFVPAVAGQPFKAASLVCTPNPPAPDTGPVVPPAPPVGSGDATLYYVYVPVNPVNPAAGETRQPASVHPGAGYTCDVTPQQYFLADPSFPGGLMPVFERRCSWSYP